MNVRFRPRTTWPVALALLTAVTCPALAPRHAEAQVLDRLKQARQQADGLLENAIRCALDDSKCIAAAKAQPQGDKSAPQMAPATLEDGRYVATFTSGSGVHRFSGPAIFQTRRTPDSYTITLCKDDPPAGTIYFSYSYSGFTDWEGDYVVVPSAVGGAKRVHLLARRMPQPVGTRGATTVQPGSSVSLTSVSDHLAAGTLKAVYRDGVLEAQFRARTVGAEERKSAEWQGCNR